MADYSYNRINDKIRPAPVRTDEKEVDSFTEEVRRALENIYLALDEIYKVINSLVNNKADV